MSRKCSFIVVMLAASVLPMGCAGTASNQPEAAVVAPAGEEKAPSKPAEMQKAVDSTPKPSPETAKPAPEASKAVAETPKAALEAPKVAPQAPKAVSEAPKAAKEAPKVVKEAPKAAPTAAPTVMANAKVAKPAPAAPATAPATTKPARKPAEPRKASDAVSEVNRNPKRHEGFLATIKKGEPHQIVFIGDSITDGWPGKGKASWAKFAEYKPLDLGVSGERTEDVLFRLNHGELEGYKPKVAVIMIGTNNIGHNRDEKPEWVAAGIEKIVKTIQDKQPDTKILLLGIFPRETAASANRAKIKEINSLIAKLDDGKKVKFLDIGAKFLDDKGEIPADVMGDKLHPSGKGYDIWYEAMWPTLSGMLK